MEPYSVLMSLYAKEKPEFLSLAIDSMVNQTVKPEQIIIVEDGPLNDSLDMVVEKYVESDPGLFTIIKKEQNLGLGLALNDGLLAARNELVARMDTDDISVLNRCERQLKVFESDNGLSIVGSWVDEFCETIDNVVSTRIVPENNRDIYEFSKKRSAFNHPVVMYKKSSVLEAGGYSDLRRNQDIDLFGRMLFKGYKAYNIQESLLYFRTNLGLAKRRKSWENTKSYIKTIKRFWKIGYSSFSDYITVLFCQMVLFLMPARLQSWFYKRFLRSKNVRKNNKEN